MPELAQSEVTIQWHLIEHMIDHHQYIPLYAFIQTHSSWQNRQITELVALAQAIVKGDNSAIERLAPSTKFAFLTEPSYLERRTYNFWHALTIQLERQEYADYLRALTPLLVDVYRLIIEEDILPNLNDYMEPITKAKEDGEAIYRGLQWSETAIESGANMVSKTFQHFYGDRFNYSHYVSSSHLLKIIEFNSKDSYLIDKAHEMRNIEKYLRNLVAHEVIHVNSEWIEKRANRSPNEIHQLLKDLYDLAGLNDQQQWESLATIDYDLRKAFRKQFEHMN